MRSCAFCSESLDGRRCQAIYCSNSCRAAASRARAAEPAAEPRPAPSASEGIGTAQNRTKGLIRADEYRPATASEETRALRVMRDHADLWDEAA